MVTCLVGLVKSLKDFKQNESENKAKHITKELKQQDYQLALP